MKHSNQIVLLQKKNIFIYLFILILICEIYISSFKVNLVLQILFLVGILATCRNHISVGFLKKLLPLLLIFSVGIIVFFLHSYEFKDLVKDISYFIKPIVALMVGYFSFKKVTDINLFYKSILYVGLFSSVIHLAGMFLFGDFFNASIADLRGNFGFDNFIEIIAFYILLFSRKLSDIPFFNRRIYARIISFIILLSVFMYFSRTMFVVFFLIGFSLLGYTKLTKSSLKIIGLAIIAIALFYSYLFSIRIDRNSEGLEGFFYKLKIAPEEIFKTRIDRENHQELWDHWRGYEANRAIKLMEKNPESFIFGTGQGSLVNLKFQAPLGTEGTMKYISRLHNGYVFVLYKTGFIGLFLYFLFIVKLYLKIYKKENDGNTIYFYRLLSSIGVFYMFTSLIISGLYISKDAVIFILGGLFALEESGIKIER